MTSTSLHRAVYAGDLKRVRELIAAGADVNGRAKEGEGWITALGERPRPLNCCTIAWTLTEDHLEIARLLLESGAVVDNSIRSDWLAEATPAEIWGRLYVLLGTAATPMWPDAEGFAWPPRFSE